MKIVASWSRVIHVKNLRLSNWRLDSSLGRNLHTLYYSKLLLTHSYSIPHLLMSSSKLKAKPLPLSGTLRDLALLRVSDLDLSSFLPASTGTQQTSSEDTNTKDIESSVLSSYKLATEARMAIKILNRGDVDAQGAKVEQVRNQLEDVLKGLEQ